MAVAARYVSRFSPVSDSRLGVTPAGGGAAAGAAGVCSLCHGLQTIKGCMSGYTRPSPHRCMLLFKPTCRVAAPPQHIPLRCGEEVAGQQLLVQPLLRVA